MITAKVVRLMIKELELLRSEKGRPLRYRTPEQTQEYLRRFWLGQAYLDTIRDR